LKKPTGTERQFQSGHHVMWESLGVCQQIVARTARFGLCGAHRYSTGGHSCALRDRRDVLALPRLGSGKTLAFGIPVIQRIMTMKSASATRAAAVKQLADIDDDDNDDVGDQADAIESADEDADQSPDEAELAECGWADGDIEEDLGLLAGSLTELAQTGSPWERRRLWPIRPRTSSKMTAALKKRGGRLYCLVLTPTRELAKQVAAHLQRVAVHTGVTVAAVLGGLSAQRQERLLAGRPDIVVGTPGRLWDLIQSGQPHLSGASASLPIAGAGRGRPAGRARTPLPRCEHCWNGSTPMPTTTIQRATSAERPPCRRQTLLFSATLTFVHRPPERPDQRRSKLKRMRQLGPDDRGRCAGRTGRNLPVVAAPQSPRPHAVFCASKDTVSELYLHRCGRTARASRSGTAVALVSPEEAGPLRRLLRGLGRGSDGDVDDAGKATIWRRSGPLSAAVTAAHSIDPRSTACSGSTLNGCGFERTAQELELDPDLPELVDSPGRRRKAFELSNHLAKLDKPTRRVAGLGKVAAQSTFKRAWTQRIIIIVPILPVARATAAGGLPRSLRYPNAVPCHHH
uniref:Helicase ATP-binding domain-containing protein n=1 Tax=Macrostomum lignano TaxID=282301 RepID=A0A1I8FQ06_9PLAT